jgi:hypothetical protein
MTHDMPWANLRIMSRSGDEMHDRRVERFDVVDAIRAGSKGAEQ